MYRGGKGEVRERKGTERQLGCTSVQRLTSVGVCVVEVGIPVQLAEVLSMKMY